MRLEIDSFGMSIFAFLSSYFSYLYFSLIRRYDDDASLFEIGKKNIAREREIIASCRYNGRERYSLYRLYKVILFMDECRRSFSRG